ncbi:MAG: DUF177 domain-containing protein [Flavobacteriaceae bacterium]|jgi:uncharacterized metal-binding protein YceD (DUF177 family)|nr:DUF177 domain-containing protein [Flavobacteriaceae bacterium]
MKVTNEYLIPFAGLKIGKHQFGFEINQKFLKHFNYEEFNSCLINVLVVLNKKSNMLEFVLKHKGSVNVPCDLTNENFDLPIKGTMNLIVKFGEEYNDDNEEMLILPHGEYQLDISQYIYEMIVLSVPSKRVHPGVKDGTLQSEILDKLQEFSVKENKIDKNETDPRWDKLKQLLTDKK